MDYKLFFSGIGLLIVGVIMVNNVRKRKPAAEENNWTGQLRPEYVKFWMTSVFLVLAGIVLVLKSL
jgi:hypothetical protein